MIRLRPILALLALVASPHLAVVEAGAQDQFGGAVAVVGDAVLVSKPLVGVGSAAVYVFRGQDGRWDVTDRLRAAGGSLRGEGFSASMAWSGEELVVASGDPEVRQAGHTFSLGSNGGWLNSGVAPLTPEANAPAADGPPEVTMATVMGILAPPQRVVAAGPGRIAVAITGSSSATATPVRVLRKEGSAWVTEAELLPEELTPRARFGAALAMAGNRLAVGAPGAPGGGVVWVYLRGEAGEWELEAVLRGEDLPMRGGDSVLPGGFGSAVAFGNAEAMPGRPAAAMVRLIVGAPGTPNQQGTAWVFARDSNAGQPTYGGWFIGTELWVTDGSNTEDQTGTGFGATIAASGSDFLIGAPGANGGRGAVARFELRRSPNMGGSGNWIPTPDLDPGFQFGSTLAIGDNVAVVGAPAARSATGAAAAYTRDSDGNWSNPTWLASDEQLQAVTGEQVDCTTDGDAAGFECDDVDLLAFLPLSALGAEPGERVSDIWGWTDPDTNREYVLVGRTAGMGIVDVTDASAPHFLGLVAANPSGARDIKVYQDFAFFTGDGAGQHGLVVFDLRRVRDVSRSSTPVDFDPDAVYDGIASAHNLVLDPEAGFAYPVGASGGGETCGGGLHMVDVRDPVTPTFAGCFTDTEGLIWEGRTHDAQCTVYSGPDAGYQGREICFVSNETALRIVDVTDKANPVPLGSASYPGVAYIHQGWLTEDQRYFYLNDELDELVGTTERTRTLIWDVSELDDPVLANDYFGPNGATDHNLYVKGDRMYQANYQAGFRVLDISDPVNPVEVGFFDTTPYDGDPPGFVGAWTAFPYFESGTVVVSSMHEGLFLLKPRRRDLIP